MSVVLDGAGGSGSKFGDAGRPLVFCIPDAVTKTAAPDSRLARPNSVRQRRSGAWGISRRKPFLRFGLNSLLWLVWSLRSLLCPSSRRVALGFFLHLGEFLLLFGRKDGLNLRLKPRGIASSFLAFERDRESKRCGSAND